MAVASDLRKVLRDGDGVTTSFPFSFRVFEASDLQVSVFDEATEISTLLSPSAYSVTLASGGVAGGTVTYPLTGSPLASSKKLLILREVPYLQPIALGTQSSFSSDVIMEGLDRAALQIQQLAEESARTLKNDPGLSSPLTFEDVSEAVTAARDAQNVAETKAEEAVASADAAALSEANAAATLEGALVKSANLSDLTSIPTARANLGLGGFFARNAIINGNFAVNQRGVSGTVTLAAGAYGHDRWKAGAAGCVYTFATANNVTTLTISSGSLLQVIEGVNLFSGTYALSWTGTAQGRIGAGSYGASGITGAVTGGTNLNIEFGTGTVSLVQFEAGSIATPFERTFTGIELVRCQRYFETGSYGRTFFYSSGWGAAFDQVTFKVNKRVSPAITANFSGAGFTGTWSTQNINAGGFLAGNDATVNSGLHSIALTYAADAEL